MVLLFALKTEEVSIVFIPIFLVPHVRNGVKYNDDQYLVKLARPADVIAEPLYANNKPDHYAVGGAVGGIIGLAEGKGEFSAHLMKLLSMIFGKIL